jgi:hypothetical protein
VFKKLVSLGLALLLLLGGSYSTYAEGKSEEMKIEAKLLKMGYNKEQIGLLSDGVKVELAKESDLGAKLVSFKHNKMNESAPQGEFSAMGEISASTLYLNLSILDYGTSSNYNTRKIYSDFKWNSNPYWKLKDKIGIAWADGWNIKSGSDVLVYQYYGQSTGKLFTQYFYDGQYTAEAGVDFENLDLKNVTPDGSEYTTKHSGWAKIEIGRYINQTPYADTERTDVLTKYFHKKNTLTANGSVSVTGGPDITVSNSSTYDWIQDLTYFNWPK